MPVVPAAAASRKYLRPRPNLDLPPLRATRALDQLREGLRLMHYSLRTEETYVYWVKAFIRFHRLRHLPRWVGRRSSAHREAPPAHEKGPATPGLVVGACQRARLRLFCAYFAGSCCTSPPCFSPLMSTLSPACRMTNSERAANTTKPMAIFHMKRVS